MGRVLTVNSAARTTLTCACCLLLLGLGPAAARAAVTIESFSTSLTNEDGSPATQAGATPFELNASFAFGESGTPEAVKDAVIGVPAGLFVNPTAVPRCSAVDFEAFECPPDSQVGLITIHAEPEGEPTALLGTAPVYMLVPEPGEIARLGAIAPTLEIPIEIPVTLRTNTDYGLNLTFEELPQATPLKAVDVTLWGVPAGQAHDSQRFPSGSAADPAGCPGIEGTSCIGGLVPSAAPEIPMLKSPTACSGPLQSRLDAISHQGGIDVAMASAPGLTGCSKLGFSPLFLASATTAETNTPTGLDLGFQVTDEGVTNPNGLAQSAVKSLATVLPPELEIDPNAIEALDACSQAEFEAQSPACPAGSEIGTGSLEIVGFDQPLAGAIYLGTPASADSLRLFLAVSSPRASAQLIGQIEPGPEVAQTAIVLPNLPQLPVEQLELKLAPEASLFLTPVRCGTYPAFGAFTPWSSPSEPLFTFGDLVFNSVGPEEGSCPGPAREVGVTLSPPAIVANGISTSLATATVTDASGIAVPADEVSFSSTDPGQTIEPVTDNLDGTYTAEIVSSTRIGAATITATDTSVEPDVFGAATLTQLPSPPLVATGSSSRLVVKITKKPARRTHDRTPTFRFTSSVRGSTFNCKLDARRFRPCTSPKTFGPLSFAPHTFRVRATDEAGTKSKPTEWKFTVRRPPPARRLQGSDGLHLRPARRTPADDCDLAVDLRGVRYVDWDLPNPKGQPVETVRTRSSSG